MAWSGASRYIRGSLIIACIVMVALMLATDITTMTNKYDRDSFSKEKLDHEQTIAERYVYILVGALLVAFIASLLLVFHNKRISRLQSLQIDQSEASVAAVNQDAQKAIERGKQLDVDYKGLEMRYKDLENAHLKLSVRANEHIPRVEHLSKRVETPDQETSARHTPVETPVQEANARHTPVETPVQEANARHIPVEKQVQEANARHIPVEKQVQEANARHIPVEKQVQEIDARHISLDKVQWLIDKLAPLKGKSIMVTAMANDRESIVFARELMRYFSSAGWLTTGLDKLVYPGKPVGLQWRVKSTPNPLAEYLAANFKTLGFDSGILLVPDLPVGEIELNVFYKP
jgi:predicted  nucleic acid-binding Zn-ribbon protein